MLGWILQGLRTGIVTTRYPRRPEPQPEGTRGHITIDAARCDPATHGDCAAACPTGALSNTQAVLRLDLSLCIQCGRCVTVCPRDALSFTGDYEVAVLDRRDLITEVGHR